MQRRTTRKTRTFSARGSDGRQYTIHEYTEYIDPQAFNDPGQVAGMKELRTFNDMTVTRNTKGEYEVLETGVTLTFDSPDRP